MATRNIYQRADERADITGGPKPTKLQELRERRDAAIVKFKSRKYSSGLAAFAAIAAHHYRMDAISKQITKRKKKGDENLALERQHEYDKGIRDKKARGRPIISEFSRQGLRRQGQRASTMLVGPQAGPARGAPAMALSVATTGTTLLRTN